MAHSNNDMQIQLDKLIENVPGIIYRCDCNENWTMNYISQEIESITGYPPSDFIDDRVRTFASIIHPDDERRVFQVVTEALEKLEPYEIHYRLIAKDGSVRHVFERGQKVFRNSGTIEKLDGFIIDVTEKVEFERELQDERSKSIQASKMATLGEMAAGMAHEINTPLAVISGAANIIMRHIEEGDLHLAEDRIDKINRSVSRISKIITGLKNFSRSSGLQNRDFYDISRVIEDAVDLIEYSFKKCDIKLFVDIRTEAKVFCNDIEIEQVLINLLNNAKDALEDRKESWIRVVAEERGDQVVIQISDSGPGVPKELHNEIFHPFFTTKPVGKGTGLGLSISHGIVESHSGELFYDDKKESSTFTLKLEKGRLDSGDLS